MLVDGYYYWVIRINAQDAAERGIGMHDLVHVHNDRGAVICAAQLTERLPRGVVHSYRVFGVSTIPIGEPGYSIDRGGCINQLTPKRSIAKKVTGTAANSCLVQVEPWDGSAKQWSPPRRPGASGGGVVKKWNLVIDVAKCFNCNCCTLACHDEYGDNEFPGYAAAMPKHGQRWIDIRHRETGRVPMVEVSYLPVMCNHCDDAAVPEGREGRRCRQARRTASC